MAPSDLVPPARDHAGKRFKILWFVWFAVFTALALYVLLATKVAESSSVSFPLVPGRSEAVRVWRIAPDNLRMELSFVGNRGRSELGDWSSQANPGALVRVVVSTPPNQAVTFHAEPASGFGAAHVSRVLSSADTSAPAWWKARYQSDAPNLRLEPGLTSLKIDVQEIGEPLKGENVVLWVLSPLGFNQCQLDVCWLWPAILWPYWLPLVLLFALALGAFHWMSRMESRSQ